MVGTGPAWSADIEAGREKSRLCAPCHGSDGNAKIPGTPSLAGQPPLYTHLQLSKFRDGRRKNDQMTTFVTRLTDNDLADLAAFYAVQKPLRRTVNVDSQRVEDGQKLAVAYQCVTCHRVDLGGQDVAPRVAGQDLVYLRKALRAHKEKIASDVHGDGTTVAMPLSDDELEALAHFLASLGGT